MIAFNLIELVCYVVFFTTIILHDNTLANAAVKPGEIKQRNRVNAFTMFGQVVTWAMEVSFVMFLFIVLTKQKSANSRELPALVKLAEFSVIPVVQILTSAPLRKFILKSER